MVKDSLKSLMDMFPYFFDKSPSSNFYKSQSVTNNQFKNLYQALFNVKESFHLEKRCLIWKEQNVPYDYVINFVANYPHLKSVKCYKNDTLIYMEEYSEQDNVSSFIYSYDSTEETDTLLADVEENEEENEDTPLVIPDDKFSIKVETYDEYIIMKGFPENDEILGDIYDHDESLDEIGAFNNIPRKTYIPTNDYANTEPPYNDRLSEDDYHYMNRILNYNLRIHDTPLPVLELWKLYGISSSLINRENSLFKMWDETMHEEGWIPKPWEHKDKLCNPQIDLGKFLFVSVNTNIPFKNQRVKFTFKFLNSYAERLSNPSYVDIYLNDTLIEENYESDVYNISATLLDEDNTNVFKFIANDGELPFGTEEIEINIAGCNFANWYVSANGDDSNTGKSLEAAFATIQKAVNSAEGEENFIVVSGSNTISSPVKVTKNCRILGCSDAVIENTTSPKFFEISQNKTLTLQDITFVNDDMSSTISNLEFNNANRSKESIVVRIGKEWEDEE